MIVYSCGANPPKKPPIFAVRVMLIVAVVLVMLVVGLGLATFLVPSTAAAAVAGTPCIHP